LKPLPPDGASWSRSPPATSACATIRRSTVTFSRTCTPGLAAHFLAELNAIHSFRDGNGRTQLAFLAEVAARAGHPLNLDRLDPEAFLQAMVASFQGEERLLAAQLRSLIQPEESGQA
jgi:fido (protein-threonine AMPylation protein)